MKEISWSCCNVCQFKLCLCGKKSDYCPYRVWFDRSAANRLTNVSRWHKNRQKRWLYNRRCAQNYNLELIERGKIFHFFPMNQELIMTRIKFYVSLFLNQVSIHQMMRWRRWLVILRFRHFELERSTFDILPRGQIGRWTPQFFYHTFVGT